MSRIVPIFAALLLPFPCLARDIYVATNGSNSNSGGPSDPYRTITYAVSQSTSGDVVHVRAGTYAESWIEIRSGTRLISENGLYAAKIYSQNSTAVRLTQSNCGIEGFEVYGNWNGGSPGDGLIRPLWSNNTWVKNCLVHDAPADQDCIKIGATNVLIENCVVYNAAPRTSGGYQECIDIYGTPAADGVTVRGCWVYHTDLRGGDNLIFAKGGSKNILWENNVFGPNYDDDYANPSISAGGPSPAVFPSAENFIARNNILVGCSGDGAFGLFSAKNVHFYNNVIYNYRGGRAAIQFYTTGVGTNEDFYCYNNVFLKTNGKPIYADRGVYSGTTYIPTNFQHDDNVYCDFTAGGDVDIYAEPHSIIGNPLLTAPAMPNLAGDTWAGIASDFLLLPASPAVNAGLNLPADVPFDVLGTPRPTEGIFDIGIHELIRGDLDYDRDVDLGDSALLVNQLSGPTVPVLYQELGRLVVIEAEHFTTRTPGTGVAAGWAWQDRTGDGSTADGYQQALPDAGQTVSDPDIESSAPRLRYQVQFVATGTYYLWVRARAPDPDAATVHFGRNGVAITNNPADALLLPVGQDFAWLSQRANGIRPALLAAPGLLSLDIWMCQDGAQIDRLLLTADPNYVPTDPPESPHGLSVSGDLDADGDVDLADAAIFAARFTGP